MQWNVYRHNINADQIEVFNIFDHGRFADDVKKGLKKCKSKEEFADQLKSILSYYYWWKSEWEVLICAWSGSRQNEPLKVDIYSQVMNNWEVFLDYVWGHKR